MKKPAKERQPVKIHITNVVRQMESEEKTEMSVSGVFYLHEGNRYLHYEERQVTGEVRTVLKLSEEELLLLRSGAVNMRMHFFRDKRRSTASIDSGAGNFLFESELVALEENFQPADGLFGEIAFQYDLLQAGSYIGSYNVKMRIEEDKEV
ncbi:DUF1934 domain-containing protein [Listeria ilorinensis]|uniref:DUF1934 domain-containing protein n=1 Tax=Listeria ilorinensis TaxID=2867439 RepID=UPI001EF3F6C3|nr:DUF1934 family protein [Listeria ilorinensis]